MSKLKEKSKQTVGIKEFSLRQYLTHNASS